MQLALRTFIATLLAACLWGPASAGEPRYQDFHLDIRTRGNFLWKTVQEIGSPEGQAIIVATCGYFGLDCTKAAAALGAVARLTKQDGEQSYVSVYSPEGYALCRVYMPTSVRNITRESTLNGRYNAAIPEKGLRDRLSLYAVVPVRRVGHWVNVHIAMMYVEPTERDKYGCAPHRKVLFRCKGADCSLSEFARKPK